MRRMLLVIGVMVVSVWGEDWAQRPGRVGAGEFPVIAWSGSPTGAEALGLMREAGLNVTGFCRESELDGVEAAGMQCIVARTKLEGMVDRPETTDAEIRAEVAALAGRIGARRGVFGVYLRDEPNVKQMPMLGRLAAELMRAMPDKVPYVNLFPNYASRAQLGSDDYAGYVGEYVKRVKTPYVSWDNYSLTDGEMQQSFYDNLELMRKVAGEAGVPFWNCILSTALFRYMEPSDATLSLQVYATLAYGGRGIQYFTYFTADNGNFRLAPVDVYGNRTATWEMMRRMNNQIHALAPTMVKLRSTGVYHWPVSTAAGTRLLKEVRTSGKLLIGEFEDGAGRPYVLLVNKSLKESVNIRPGGWKEGAVLYRVSPASGKEGVFGAEADWLAPGGGVLLRIGEGGK